MAESATPIPGDVPPVTGPADTADDAVPTAERRFTAEIDGRRFEVALRYDEPAGGGGAAPATRAPKRKRSAGGGGGGGGGAPNEVVTPMQGTVLRVVVEEGQEVTAGTVIAIVEAMKMENEVMAHQDGTVREVRVTQGQGVAIGEVLAIVE